MKNILFLVILFLGISVNAQRKPKIKGNKNVTQVREELPPFNAVELVDDLEIYLKSSRVEGYTIEADDNLIDILKFKVVDSTLLISSFYNITSKKRLDITINYNVLNGITLKDGKMKTDNITTDYLYVNTFDSSKIELNADAGFVDVNMEENSSGDFNINSDSLNVVLKDRVDVRIYSVSETNSIEVQKNAAAKMEGTTNVFQIKLTGNASLKAEKLEAASTTATVEESSVARIYTYKDFDLSSSGSGKTYLSGDSKITISEFLDTSQLHKQKN